MRPLMIFFDLLDAGIVIPYINRLPQYVRGLQHQPLLSDWFACVVTSGIGGIELRPAPRSPVGIPT